MGVEEQDVQPVGGGKPDATKSPTLEHGHKPSNPRVSTCSTDKDDGLSLCRVCHCVEPDLRGESALGFLGIVPPSPDPSCEKDPSNDATKNSTSKVGSDAPTFLEFISPEGEIFKCATDIESGHLRPQDDVVNLGCSCKNELALAHYACAPKWFISHGSTVCKICGNVTTNVRPEDFNTVLASLKDYEALRERTSTGDLSYLHYRADESVDPVALAAVRRQRLCEISVGVGLGSVARHAREGRRSLDGSLWAEGVDWRGGEWGGMRLGFRPEVRIESILYGVG